MVHAEAIHASVEGRVSNFGHRALEGLSEVGVHFNLGLVAKVNAHDVAFVDLDVDLHGAEVADVEDDLTGGEAIALNAFTHFFDEGGDDACLRGAERGSSQIVLGFLQRRLPTSDGVFGAPNAFVRAGQVGVGGEVGGFGLVVLGLGNDLLGEEGLRSLKRLFRRQLVGLPLRHLSTGGSEVGLGGIQRGFCPEQRGIVNVWVELHQEVALGDDVAFFHGEFGDLAVDLRRDFHLHFRLNFSAGADAFHNGPTRHFFGAHHRQFAVAAAHDRHHHEQKDKGTKAEKQFLVHGLEAEGSSEVEV